MLYSLHLHGLPDWITRCLKLFSDVLAQCWKHPDLGNCVGEGPNCVVAADENSDGKMDFLTANHMGGTLSILIYVPISSINFLSKSALVSWPSSWTNWTFQQNPNLATYWPTSAGISNDGTNKRLTINFANGRLVFPFKLCLRQK